MPISVACPSCEYVVNARDEFAGKRAKCPKCQAVVAIPQPPPPPTPAPEADARRLVVNCPQCSFTITARYEFAGKSGKCPKCATVVVIPALETAAEKPQAVLRANVALATATPSAARAAAPRPQAVSPAAARLAAPALSAVKNAAAKPTAAPARSKMARQEVLRRVLEGFQGGIPHLDPMPMYFVGILMTSVVMLALPLIYIALIGLIGCGVFLHTVHDTGMMGVTTSGRGAVVMIMLYLAPIISGAILVAFMIKPLFAKSGDRGRTRSLTRHSEPVLFALVEKICQVVGSRTPSRIDVNCDVNASASFEGGMLGALTGGNLVLTIGVPLASGLSMQQFAGVLAHEFGHFSQGAGMRLTYIIRSINFWLIRAVYQRDAWDDWLVKATTGDSQLAWLFYLARLGVWLTRKVLWVLMMFGHLVAGFMLRQMEFDADTYEVRLVGSQTFETTARQLILLNAAHQAAQSDAQAFYRERRLPDNLPRLMVNNIRFLADDVRVKLNKFIDESKTDLFASHPADKDRIAAAYELAEEGVFLCKLPASALFTDFESTSRGVTYDFYHGIFGAQLKPDELHPVQDLISRQDQEIQAGDARKRFFGEHFTTLRPWRLPDVSFKPLRDSTVAENQLRDARQYMMNLADAYPGAVRAYLDADSTIVETRQVGSLLNAKTRVQREFNTGRLSSEGQCRDAREAARQMQASLRPYLEPFENAAGQRLGAALELLGDPAVAAAVANSEAKRLECRELWRFVALVAGSIPTIVELRNEQCILGALFAHIGENEQNQALFLKIHDYANRLYERLIPWYTSFSREPYPFDHRQADIRLSTYMLEELPAKDDIGHIYRATGMALENLMAIYVRALDRLCLVAEEVETVLGGEPLPFPKVETA